RALALRRRLALCRRGRAVCFFTASYSLFGGRRRQPAPVSLYLHRPHTHATSTPRSTPTASTIAPRTRTSTVAFMCRAPPPAMLHRPRVGELAGGALALAVGPGAGAWASCADRAPDTRECRRPDSGWRGWVAQPRPADGHGACPRAVAKPRACSCYSVRLRPCRTRSAACCRQARRDRTSAAVA